MNKTKQKLVADLVKNKRMALAYTQKEVSEWKYGKPTGVMTQQLRPVCPSDHFGLFVQFADTSTTTVTKDDSGNSNKRKAAAARTRKKRNAY